MTAIRTSCGSALWKKFLSNEKYIWLCESSLNALTNRPYLVVSTFQYASLVVSGSICSNCLNNLPRYTMHPMSLSDLRVRLTMGPAPNLVSSPLFAPLQANPDSIFLDRPSFLGLAFR